MRNIVIKFTLCLLVLVMFTGCNEKNNNDDLCSDIVGDAINKTYEKKEIINSENVQKNMEGNWIIVEAPANTTRNSIPEKIDESTISQEWVPMYITVCNSISNKCKDLRLFKDSENVLYVGSESEAIVSHE